MSEVYLIDGYEYLVPPTYQKKTVEECLEWCKTKEIIAVDTETRGRDCHVKPIVCLQIGDADTQWVIDTRTVNILLFKDVLESKECILHNAKFDYKFFKHVGINLNKIYDTMLAECIIYAGYEKFGYGLDALCERYLKVTLDKDDRGGFYNYQGAAYTDYMISYAAKDVAYLHLIREKQLELIKKYNLEYCLSLENEVVKALGDIEYNGVILNKDKWLKNTEEFEKSLITIRQELDDIVLNEPKLSSFVPKYVQVDLFGVERRRLEINYESPTQVLKILKTLGVSEDDTSDRTLQKNKHIHPFIEKLKDFRGAAKIISTYGKGFLDYINPYTGKVYTSFWQIVQTGRLSSGSKQDNTFNGQNIPADNTFRNCFEARPGFSWVSCDYTSQELMLMAEGSDEEGFIEVLNKGEDLHCYVGSMMFGKTVTKQDKELRTKAKTVNFAKPYGAGPNKIADLLNISVQEAEELFELYAAKFPKLDAWLKLQGKKAKENMYSVTFSPCQRRRWYPKMKEAKELRNKGGDWRDILKIEGETERYGTNHPIQG